MNSPTTTSDGNNLSSSSCSSHDQIIPELSRSYKSRIYHSNSFFSSESKKRKRSNNNNNNSFELRSTKEKNGIGMFATQSIPCGTLIIAHEDPIVHYTTTRRRSNQRLSSNQQYFCHSCATPIGSLRGHHLQAPLEIALPCLEQTQGPIFTTSHSKCPHCDRVAWCSDKCLLQNQKQHRYLCGSDSNSFETGLEEFFKKQENPIIFQLAAQAVTLILTHVQKSVEDSWPNTEKEGNEKQHTMISMEQYYWWNDYASHPLWWEIGLHENRLQRKELTTTFCKCLRETLVQNIRRNSFKNKGAEAKFLENTVDQICTIENIGELLGMLQCNVMEFEYPSPLQQYMEHVEQILMEEREGGDDQCSSNRHEKHCDDSNATISAEVGANNTQAAVEKITQTLDGRLQQAEENDGVTWLTKNVVMHHDDSNEDKEEEEKLEISNPSPLAATPILGSGLYPLLTLANHDCDPNASIEFLQESNRGSIVALRDIAVGEEICITYVPNGGVGSTDGDFFQHFEPTRTWKWLNGKEEREEIDENVSLEDADDDNVEGGENIGNSDFSDKHLDEDGGISEDKSGDDDDDADGTDTSEEGSLEGSNQTERAKVLLEYGFECQCNRCLEEKLNKVNEAVS